MKFDKMGIGTFCTLLGSESPVPGGGAAVALQGATAASLAMMVCNLTIGKKKYQEDEELNKRSKERCQSLLEEFLLLMDEDAEAFNIVGRAYRLPKNTEEEQRIRREEIQRGIEAAVVPPMKMMETACELLGIINRLLGRSNTNVITDLGVAVLQLRGVLESGWLNVLINLKGMKNKKLADEYHAQGQKILCEAIELSDDIHNKIIELLS